MVAKPIFLMIWIAIKVLRKLLVISLLAAIFNIFRPIISISELLRKLKMVAKPKFIMQKDIIKALRKLLVVVLLVAILNFKMAVI